MEHSKKKSTKKKKRFSDEQIRSLEAIFETGTKLEPRKKVAVAREVGLQPRQIAIWFQNRRARWKSKQIEKEYKVLKANYDHLSAQFEFLAKEKQSLLVQLQKLSELLQKHQESSGTGQAKFMSEANKSIFSQQDRVGDHQVTMMNDGDCSLGSLEKLCNLESSGDQQPPGNLHWWNLWT